MTSVVNPATLTLEEFLKQPDQPVNLLTVESSQN